MTCSFENGRQVQIRGLGRHSHWQEIIVSPNGHKQAQDQLNATTVYDIRRREFFRGYYVMSQGQFIGIQVDLPIRPGRNAFLMFDPRPFFFGTMPPPDVMPTAGRTYPSPIAGTCHVAKTP